MIEYASMERENAVLKQEASKHATIVIPFLREAIQEGAHRIKPKNLSEDRWVRQRNISGIYNGSPATYQDLADVYLRTKERMRQLNVACLSNLWNNSSPELQERYAFNEILTARKPLSQRSKEKHSKNQGGKSLKVKEQVESGVRDVGEISKNTGIPEEETRRSIALLVEKWGIDTNISRDHPSHKKFLQQLAKETDDKKIQELLDQLPCSVIRRDMMVEKEASQFLALLNLVREAGFHLRSKDSHFFATSLRKAKVPVARKDIVANGTRQQVFTYYTVLLRHKDRAVRVLKEDQCLQRFLVNPVTLAYGKEDRHIPTTTKLERKDGYESLGRLFIDLGVKNGGVLKLRYPDIFTPDCPVPIYRMCDRSSCYYPVAQENELRSFITEKLSFLKIDIM